MVIKLPKIEPLIKLTPTIKLIGKLTVLFITKLTLLLFELFCIPIISNKNKQELNANVKNIFLKSIEIEIIF